MSSIYYLDCVKKEKRYHISKYIFLPAQCMKVNILPAVLPVSGLLSLVGLDTADVVRGTFHQLCYQIVGLFLDFSAESGRSRFRHRRHILREQANNKFSVTQGMACVI